MHELQSPIAAEDVLTQVNLRRSPAVLDAFADSLVAIAITVVPEGSGESRGVRDPSSFAAAALVFSANPPVEGAIPYPRAFKHLVRIYREASDRSTRGSVLNFISRMPDESARAIDLFAEVAQSRGIHALSAVRYLEGLGEAGRARLRQLMERGEIRDPEARGVAEGIARRRGWGD